MKWLYLVPLPFNTHTHTPHRLYGVYCKVKTRVNIHLHIVWHFELWYTLRKPIFFFLKNSFHFTKIYTCTIYVECFCFAWHITTYSFWNKLKFHTIYLSLCIFHYCALPDFALTTEWLVYLRTVQVIPIKSY